MSAFDSSWLSMLGVSLSDRDRVARMADLIVDMNAVRPSAPAISLVQAKGRGLRGNGPTKFTYFHDETPDMTLVYKRRHKRQTRRAFPFTVRVRWAGKLITQEMNEWCQQWGEQRRDWDVGGQVYFFKVKAHATLFVLAFKGRDGKDS